MDETCPLCDREVPTTSGHHRVPKSRGGRERTEICLDCHRTIHTFFTLQELESELSTVEALKAHPKMQGYLVWIRKRPAGTTYRALKPYNKRRFTRCRKRIA